MKKLINTVTKPGFHSGGEDVECYRSKDLLKIQDTLLSAEHIWYDEWQAQGGEDEGTCCGGKGLEVYVVEARGRTAKPTNIVRCYFVQGNLSASRSCGPALEYLKNLGIDASYNDGWMD